MKTYFKHSILILIVSLFFASCQDEAVQLNLPDSVETVTVNSTLFNLMLRTSANATSDDDVLDNTSCFSVQLPVTVGIGNITIIVENEEGLDELEELLESFEDEIPEFVFPITIISADYTETIIENQTQLEAIIQDCIEQNSIDCIDFVYPISFSEFNSQFVIINTVTINSNTELYQYLENIDDDGASLVALNFPVTLQYANGETLEVNSNIELSDVISIASEECENYEENCDVDEVRLSLKECRWDIEVYSSFPEFEDFQLEFNDDFSFGIVLNNGTVVTETYTWEIAQTDNGLIVTINSDFEDFGGEWLVVQCDDDELQLIKGNQTMVIEKQCEGDLNCDAEELSTHLTECFWFAGATFINTPNNIFVFNTDGSVQASIDNQLVVVGVWNVGVDSDNLTLVLNLTGDYAELSGVWEVIDCHEGFFGIQRDDEIVHLEQDCNISAFQCFDNAVFELVECANAAGEADFNLDASVEENIQCDLPFLYSFHITEADADNNVTPLPNTESFFTTSATIYLRVENHEGSFEVYPMFLNANNCNEPSPFECYEGAVFELVECANDAGEANFNLDVGTINVITCPVPFSYSFHFSEADAQANNSPIINSTDYLSVSGTVYLRIEDVNNEFQMYPVYLNAIDCNLFECFESFDAVLEQCDENNDGVEVFNLPIAFDNCIPTADAVSYYNTLNDAQNNTNALSNPEAYTSNNSVETIYVRVEIDGQVEVFELLIKIVDCTNAFCTEGDVDGIIGECEWEITELNGDDNLINYVLDFNANQELIITNTENNETVIGTWSTSTNATGNVDVTFDEINAPNIQAISGIWTVVECTPNQLIFHKGDEQMTLDKICE